MKEFLYKILIITFCLLVGCTTIKINNIIYSTDQVLEKNNKDVELTTKSGVKYKFADSNFVDDLTTGAIKGITKTGEKISFNTNDVDSYKIIDERLIKGYDKILAVELKNEDIVLFDKEDGGKLDYKTNLITGYGKSKTNNEINIQFENEVFKYCDGDFKYDFDEHRIPLKDTRKIAVGKEREESSGSEIIITFLLLMCLPILLWLLFVIFNPKIIIR